MKGWSAKAIWVLVSVWSLIGSGYATAGSQQLDTSGIEKLSEEERSAYRKGCVQQIQDERYQSALECLAPLVKLGGKNGMRAMVLMGGLEAGTLKATNLNDPNSWVKEAVEKGNAKAQFTMGIFHQKGLGVPKNMEKAVSLFQLSAAQGEALASVLLARIFETGDGVPVDPVQSLKWQELGAEQGSVLAQRTLGIGYFSGIAPFPKDHEKALKWLQLAAEQGDAASLRVLGTAYLNGDGVKQDPEKAVEYFKKSAEKGDATAQYQMGTFFAGGIGVTKSQEKAHFWFRKSAENGHVKAQSYMGNYFINGQETAPDLQAALKWFLMAANQGELNASLIVGTALLLGDGLPRDVERGIKYIRIAAEGGNASAQIQLGSLYFQGHGVEENCPEAIQWFTKAAEQGKAEAQIMVGSLLPWGDEGQCRKMKELAATGDEDKQSEQAEEMLEKHKTTAEGRAKLEASFRWIRLAAVQGNAGAQWVLGTYYASGFGVEKNPLAGATWLSLAVEKGTEGAAVYLERVTSGLSDRELAQVDESRARCLKTDYTDCP